MKKIFAVLMLSLLFAVPSLAQFDSGYPQLVRSNGYLEIRIEAMLDSASSGYDSIATTTLIGWVDISDFDNPLQHAQLFWDVDLIETGPGDTSGVLIEVWGSETASWTDAVSITQIVDTSGASAGTADYYVSTTSIVPTYVASTLSNKRPKYITIVFENRSKTGNLHTFDDSLDVSAVFRLPVKEAKIQDE